MVPFCFIIIYAHTHVKHARARILFNKTIRYISNYGTTGHQCPV